MTDNSPPGDPLQPVRPRGLGPILISARPLDEYLAMFALAVEDLCRWRVLDCPSGVGSTAARWRRSEAGSWGRTRSIR
jgi:hypothetical protein